MSKTTVYYNGKIFTSDPRRPYGEAMAIKDGRVIKLGDFEDMPEAVDVTVDLKGRRVLPGLIDNHMHPTMLAEYSKKISCLPPKINSIEQLIDAISKVYKEQGTGKWIEGWGYDEGKLAEKRSPNRYDLDKGAPDAPVVISRTCGHIRCVNSKALEIAGITKDTPDPPDGQIDRDENGEPTGILREGARNLMISYVPAEDQETVVNNIVDMGHILSSQGITAVCDMGNLDKIDYYSQYWSAAEKGFKQKVAIYYMWEYFVEKNNLDFRHEKMDRNDQIFQAGLKLVGDGSISGRTAWVVEPYLNGDDTGIAVYGDQLIDSAIDFCKEHRCQLSVHSMGGRAVARAVDRVIKEEKWMEDNVPHLRLEHVTEPTLDSLEKCREHQIAISTQPIFMYAEIESYVNNLDEERLKEAYPVNTILDKGVKLSFSSDAPATSWADPSDPFPAIESAVTRTAYDGTDCGVKHAISVEDTIILYTRESAEVAGFKDIGVLKEGYKGDFIVLSQDILEVDPKTIHQVCVEETYIEGELVFRR